MLNLAAPPASVSMLLEIEKLVLDEISDFTPPNQGVNLCPAPEGHRDPIAKLLSSSSRNKRFNSNCDPMIKMMTLCDYVDCDEADEEEEEEEDDDDENDENSDSRNYHENGSEIDVNCGDDKRRRKRGEGGDEEYKECDKEKEKRKRKGKVIKVGGIGGAGVRNRIRKRRPTGNNNEDTNAGLVEMNSELFLHEDDYCLSPDHDSRSGSPSPVHLISGPNGHQPNNKMINNTNINHTNHGEFTHDTTGIHGTNHGDQLNSPDGCEKVNMVKNITKKSIRPLNSLSHVVLAPCPQKPCNPGFVLLPSQSSAFLPLTRPPSDHLTHLDNITNRLNNTDLIGNEYYQSINNKTEVNN